jgi:hypothetical protein
MADKIRERGILSAGGQYNKGKWADKKKRNGVLSAQAHNSKKNERIKEMRIKNLSAQEEVEVESTRRFIRLSKIWEEEG